MSVNLIFQNVENTRLRRLLLDVQNFGLIILASYEFQSGKQQGVV